MLTIYSSNSMTRLAAALAEQLAVPLASPLQPEQVVTMGPAMARWLNLQLCGYAGVVANTLYPLPASAVWELASGVLADLPQEDPFSREQMAWRIHALLPQLAEQPEYGQQRVYLRDDPGGLKRWQLAERIADVFDRYQLYRPDLIRRWSAADSAVDDSEVDANQAWQRHLWRQLLQAGDELAGKHRVASVDRLLARLKQGAGSLTGLPERLSLFGVSTLPPLLVEVFAALATVIEVKLYLHSPTPHYWSDLTPRKQIARQRLEQPEAAHLWTVGNALLASWGRQGQAFQDLLLETGPDFPDLDAFEQPVGDTVLSRIKRDIFELAAEDGVPAAEPHAADPSLSIHVCHSAMRECQVLRDHLLACMQRDPALRPEEILVLVPNITDYAPFIEAVFGRGGRTAGGGGDDQPPLIPWNLSDVSPLDEHPLIRVFLELLALPESRYSHSELLSWLDVPAISEHFGLEAVAIDWLRVRFSEADVRWGRDGEHKQLFELPPTEQNTWRQALQRLFAGYAFGDTIDSDDGLFAGIAPLGGVAGNDAEALGGFAELLARLDHFRVALARPRSPADWCTLLTRLLDELFEQRDEDHGKLQQIHDAVAGLRSLAAGALGDEPLSPPLLRYWMEQQLGDDSRGGRYFRGGVTFCGMKPMRGLPFRQVCLLGMQDQDFPRRSPNTEFDRMASDWRHGDPRPGDEDRYLFLEALLAAGQGLSISYTGRDPKDNAERQPSVLVRELMDYLDERFVAPVDDDGKSPPFSAVLTSVYPLQAYSPRNYRELDSASFDGYWREVGEKIAMPSPVAAIDHWPQRRLPALPEPLTELPLEQLRRFIIHPPRYFVQTRLGCWLGDDDPRPQDDERFGLDGLQGWCMRQTLMQSWLDGRDTGRDWFDARGELPHGGLGGLAFNDINTSSRVWLGQLCDYRQQPVEARLIDLNLVVEGHGELQISGQLQPFYPGLGLLHASYSSLKGKHLLNLWLDYLLLVAQSGPQAVPAARLLCRDQALAIERPLSAAQAREHLAGLLRLYLDGLHSPPLLLPAASFAYACADDADAGMAKAAKAWHSGDFSKTPGDDEDPYIRLLRRGVQGSPLQHEAFPRLARRLYRPALTAVGLATAEEA